MPFQSLMVTLAADRFDSPAADDRIYSEPFLGVRSGRSWPSCRGMRAHRLRTSSGRRAWLTCGSWAFWALSCASSSASRRPTAALPHRGRGRLELGLGALRSALRAVPLTRRTVSGHCRHNPPPTRMLLRAISSPGLLPEPSRRLFSARERPYYRCSSNPINCLA